MDIDKLPRCPECGEILARAVIKLVDGNGWVIAWICTCSYKEGER
jgi:lysyl-tRNA synthetase class I